MHSSPMLRAGLTSLAAILAAAALVPARAQSAEVLADDQKLIEYEKQNSELMNNLEYLSDMIGPRLTGSDKLKKANDWTAEKMKEYGLENVHLEKWTIPMGWERGICEARVIEPNGMPIECASYAWGPGTKGKVTGPVVYLPFSLSDADLEKHHGKLKNAIILSSPPANVDEHPSRTTPEQRRARGLMGTDETDEARALQRQGSKRTEFLVKEGAAAVLLDSGKPHMLLNMTGGWGGLGGSTPRITTLFTAHEHYAMLYRLVQRGVPVTMQVHVENKFKKGPVDVYNTVGEIRGSEKPDEIVLCGAHLDSWDLGTGTTDNGTGSMTVLEAARLIKATGLKPKRTIRFVLFSGEEQGLFGSREYVKAHQSELGKVSAVFVHDTGTGRVTGLGLHGNGQVRPVLEKELGVLKALGLENWSTYMMGGTDHASFYASGVPGFWFMQDSADYGWMHHSQSDTFDKALKDDLTQGATMMAVCAYNVAQLPEMLPRRSTAATGSPGQ